MGVKDQNRLISWIYQIARHAIIDHYRVPDRRREMPAGLAAISKPISHYPPERRRLTTPAGSARSWPAVSVP